MVAPPLPIRLPAGSATTCVRVPVEVSHSESVQIEFDSEVSVGQATKSLNEYDGLVVIDDPSRNQYPMPLDATGKNDVFVGRIRKDIAHEHGLALWLSCDNLRKGAALNALQIMDEALRKNALTPLARHVGNVSK